MSPRVKTKLDILNSSPIKMPSEVSMTANGEDRKEKEQKDMVDENFFETKEFKIKQMRNKMEDEKMEALRKLPLNVVN